MNCDDFFGFQTRPFSLTPDLRFAYHSRSHSHALAEVTEALRRREGLIVVTGEIGTGKTMLCRTLLEGFKEARTFLSVILDPLLTVDDLLYRVLADFGLIEPAAAPAKGIPEATRHQLVSTLQAFLASLIPLNAHAVIMIDEAQHLSPGVLEQIRLLSNFETQDAKLLQIVLVGQPDLDALLRRPEMLQLNQRVARRCELYPLSSAEVNDYIARRLSIAAGPQPDADANIFAVAKADADAPHFTPDALSSVSAISRGVPRVVNTLCDRALDVACERQTRTVERDAVLEGAKRLKIDLEPTVAAAAFAGAEAVPGDARIPGALTGQSASKVESAKTDAGQRRPLPAALLALGAIAAVVAIWMWMGRGANRDAASSGQPAPAGATQAPAAPAATPSPPAQQPPSPSTPAAAPQTAPPPAAPGVQAQPRADGTYYVAIAAFRTAKRAIDVATDVAANGYPVSTRPDSTGQWYQVVVGPFDSAQAASAAQARLAREGFPDSRVVSTGPEPRQQ